MKSFNSMLIELLPRLRAYAIMLSRDRSTADDILQNACMRALAAQSQFQEGTNFSAWMHRIVRNAFINEWRMKKRAPLAADGLIEGMMSTNTHPDDIILLGELAHAMKELPASNQEAVLLVCGSGLSYEEAAEVQGCRVGTLKSRLFRAKTYLAEVVAYDGRAPSAKTTDTRPVDRSFPLAAKTAKTKAAVTRKLRRLPIPVVALIATAALTLPVLTH